jgi:hypothetical protein
MPMRKKNRRPDGATMEAAHRIAQRETPTAAREWLRANNYAMTREEESDLYLRVNGATKSRCTRKGWRVLKATDLELAALSGRNLSMSAALRNLRGKGISVPRAMEAAIDAIISPDNKQPALRLVGAPTMPEVATAETILAAVRLATGKASKADIAAVAKAIGADAAIKLLTTGA